MCRALVKKSLAFSPPFFSELGYKRPYTPLNHTLPQGIAPVRKMREAYDMAQNNLDLNIYLDVMFTGFLIGF